MSDPMLLFDHEVNLCMFFFKQKTAYEMRISDWSSDVCSSDLAGDVRDLVERQRSLAQQLGGMAVGIHASAINPRLGDRGGHRLAQLLGVEAARLRRTQRLLTADRKSVV